MTMIKTIRFVISVACFGLVSVLHAQALDTKFIQSIGPLSAPPLIQIDKHSAKASHSFSQELNQSLVSAISMADDVGIAGQSMSWQAFSAGSPAGHYGFKLPLQTMRYSQGKIVLNGLANAQAYLNGRAVTIADDSMILTLKNGDHVLTLLANVDDMSKVKFNWQGDTGSDVVGFYQPKKRRVYAQQLFDSEVVSQLSVSPDAKQYIISKKHFDADLGDKAITTMELRATKSNDLLQRWQERLPYSLKWSANNKQLAFIDGGIISLLNRGDREIAALTPPLKDISSLHWYDDSTLIFSWKKTPKKENKVTKHYRALQDRWSGWRSNSQLYQIDVTSGIISQLTSGKSSTYLLDSKENNLLVSRSMVDYKQPAHSLTELSELDLRAGKQHVIGQYRTFNSAKYAKNGLYVLAGPSFEQGLGRAVADGVIANNYDAQLYFRDEAGQFSALSKAFDPSIGQIKVLPNDDLMIRVTEKDGSSLYHYDTSKQRFNKVDTGFEVVESFSSSHSKTPLLLVKGTSAIKPQQAIAKKLNSRRHRVLFDSAKQSYGDTQLGQFKSWDFTNSRGDVISGRYYLPPNFDSTKKYPALVYYYGGTSPVSRAFTGRYPFNLWAAQGYVVYVIQPSGATGFGQNFSGRHVNAWGKYTAQDIIEGTKAFTMEHQFVDASKIGNLGASYGGFMTMLLATQTDLFAASLSHAGISNISNYWGYGWWGYAYSGVASQGSFPWNNRELYVQQSPLYHADKINHPLLLIHGDGDTNVPVSESHSMYTALKLLDKPVDLIEFKGQNHTINSRKERLVWWDTTLAFFDKHLKEQPQWWDTLYSD